MTDVAGFVTPVWQALVIGSVFVAVGLLGSHSPRPHDAPLSISGPPAQVSALIAGLKRAQPGGYAIRRVAGRQAGIAALRRGETYAVITVAAHGTIDYAGANGPTVTANLTRLIPAIGARQGIELQPIDALPLRKNDAAALPTFYLVFGVVLASYLFAVTSVVLGAGLPPRGHWFSAAVLACVLGPTAALLGRFLTRTLDADGFWAAIPLLILASLATSSATWLCLRSSKLFGSLVASIVFVILASASGGIVPAEFLPPWLGALRPVLPMGAALTGIRDAMYFDGTDMLGEIATLTGWALLALAVARAIGRRSAPATSQTASQGSPHAT